MNEEIKKVWIEALESGNYVQGKGALHRTDDTYCCLGVLCDLAVEAGVAKRVTGDADDDGRFIYGPVDVAFNCGEGNAYLFSDGYLPPVVVDWAGLDDAAVDIIEPRSGEPASLALINDEYATFPEIAEIIREQL